MRRGHARNEGEVHGGAAHGTGRQVLGGAVHGTKGEVRCEVARGTGQGVRAGAVHGMMREVHGGLCTEREGRCTAEPHSSEGNVCGNEAPYGTRREVRSGAVVREGKITARSGCSRNEWGGSRRGRARNEGT